jgi:cysteine synthase
MFDHIADAIKTPVVIKLTENLYVARFEMMKLYSTLVAVERLLANGTIRKGDTLVDSSSGLYAYSLALACHKLGMRCHIIASKVMDVTIATQIELLGAVVEQVQPAGTLKQDQSLRVQRIEEMLRTNPRVHWMQQYHDDIHYAGYVPVAEQIRADIDSDKLTIVGAVGSGASTGGLISALRAVDRGAELIGIQPFGSVTFGSEHIDDPGIIIAGIGSAIPFRNVRHKLYDRIHWVSFEYGMSGSIALLRRHGVFAGLSSGCGYLVASYEAAAQPDRRVVFVAADTGHRYMDTVFARHRDARDIDTLAPIAITAIEELALPWSMMAWNRRAAPVST